MFRLLRKVSRDTRGQDLIEYMLLGTLIAIAAYLGVMNLGVSLSGYFTGITKYVENVSESGGGGAGGSTAATPGGGPGDTGSSGTTGSGSGIGNGGQGRGRGHGN